MTQLSTSLSLLRQHLLDMRDEAAVFEDSQRFLQERA